MPHESAVYIKEDSVRRPADENSLFVADVLRALEEQGFDGAPRLHKLDDEHITVSFLQGRVLEAECVNEAQLFSYGRLLCRVHDTLAAHPISDSGLVIHGDCGPHNVAFDGDDAVGLFDWEFARRGTRVGELTDAAWCLVARTWEREDPAVLGRRIGMILAGYNGPSSEEVIDNLICSVKHHSQHNPALYPLFTGLLVRARTLKSAAWAVC